ncbi:hypothetical protein MBEHAL_1955 [Halarchaeum acidiphilum MH1-52-1]|uniref:Uncharacterized protein n=1 Tax=Halarchaeum acidiphilum MH1-52-1 TaxID=1261545 RepID=U2YVY9_9EURY|nr:hypothetical protein [Halarchaeum acidiphilum]GAD53195.1 hypothetical protein MBEHAL_1955 [Halarchaeum acidiphilum MH1-52-1]
MSPHDFREAVRERANARVLLGWVVVAAVLTVARGGSLADFALLAAAGVAVPLAAALADTFGVPRRVRRAGGGVALLALGVAIIYFGIDAHAVLLVLVGVAAGLVGAHGLIRAVRDPPTAT